MSENLLGRETSPYLLQHADNPVHWQPWGPEALASAKKDNKPILLSVGYAACHWCHVMAHESFENDDIAGLMNDHFINIKVDREERPDIDAIYQSALAGLGQQGGWPLTMFLTPDGEPFWGGTYFPPDERYGRPGFSTVLTKLSQVFQTDMETVEQNRRTLLQHLNLSDRASANDAYLPPDCLTSTAEQVISHIDIDKGGLGGAPKFPNIPVFELLWRARLETDIPEYGRATEHTLERMCEGGIYDHLGGGFARYSVDADWFAPHFEKMLYDNAQILEILGMVWQRNNDPLLRRRIHETIDWLKHEMIAENGAFAATLDADSEGQEGKFYIWTMAEIAEYLGTEADYFCQTYGVREHGNWQEGGKDANILNRLHLPFPPDEMDEARLEPMRRILRRVRDGRVRPGWDDKVLADWNGQMISALARLSAIFRQPEWLDMAVTAFEAVQRDMSRESSTRNARLSHSWRLGQAKHEGMLDDYVHMVRASLALYEQTSDERYLDYACAWTASLDLHFWDPGEGGYFFTADDAEALIVRTKTVADSAIPAGNAVMLENLHHLYQATGDPDYQARIQALVGTFATTVAANPIGCATFVNNFDTFSKGLQIIIIGDHPAEDTTALLNTINDHSLPGRIVGVVKSEADLVHQHPAKGKTRLDGKATAYVCQGQTCSLPITEPSELAAFLS
jgi:uncharacterized protein YyaL (SSP411 family)